MGQLLFCIVLAWQGAPPAEAWCDVVFKDVVHQAEIVLVTRANRPKGGETELEVLDVVKGAYDESIFRLPLEQLREHGVRNHDHVLLALTGDRRLIVGSPGMGACFPVSLVRFRGKRLRGQDRVRYDSRREPITLDELRRDLLGPRR